MYCPEGSSAPSVAPAGYYTFPPHSDYAIVALQCPVGSYCVTGERQICPAGTYQDSVLANHHSNCTACLREGFYCPAESASPVKCGGDEFYCPPGATKPLLAGAGYYTQGPVGAKFAALVCPPGSFCPGDGKASLCPPGRFGDANGLSNDSCSGVCANGTLCSNGTTSARGRACPAGYYCAAGQVHPCPSGTFNPTEGAAYLDNCTLCPPGKFNSDNGAWSAENCTACPPHEGSNAGASACWPGVFGTGSLRGPCTQLSSSSYVDVFVGAN